MEKITFIEKNKKHGTWGSFGSKNWESNFEEEGNAEFLSAWGAPIKILGGRMDFLCHLLLFYFDSWQLWTFSIFLFFFTLWSWYMVLGSCMLFLLSSGVDGLPAGLTCPRSENQRMYYLTFYWNLELHTSPQITETNLEWNEKPNKELLKVIQDFFFFHFF